MVLQFRASAWENALFASSGSQLSHSPTEGTGCDWWSPSVFWLWNSLFKLRSNMEG